jgi:hypothetical protein
MVSDALMHTIIINIIERIDTDFSPLCMPYSTLDCHLLTAIDSGSMHWKLGGGAGLSLEPTPIMFILSLAQV